MERKIYTVEELMMDDSFFNYCLGKQVADNNFWEKEIAVHPDQKAIFAEARYTIILLHGKLDDNEVSRQVKNIKKLIDVKEKQADVKKLPEPGSLRSGIKKQHQDQKPVKYFRKTYIIYGIAASMLVFLGLILFKGTSSKAITQPKWIDVSYNSGIGQRKTISLPDGSVAILSSNSSITFAGDFNQNQRVIKLSGEAFFRVAKNPAKPFIVHSGIYSVTAVGTSFYVQAGNRGNDYSVKLLEGKVLLASGEIKSTNHETAQTMLLPGEEGIWESTNMSFKKTPCDSMALKKWVSGKLSFKNMPVEKVLDLLQQWYGMDIEVKHRKWTRLALTGDYNNKPLDHVLKIICFSLSAQYSYSGTRVIIE